MVTASIPILILLTGCAAQLALGRVLNPVAKGWLAAASAILALAAVVSLTPVTMTGAVLTAPLLPGWDGTIPIALRIDGLTMLFWLMGCGAGSAILLFSVRYMAQEAEGVTRFYMLMLVFIAGLLVLSGADNLLAAYLAWEVIGLCSYGLVGFWYKQRAATDGARKVLLITHLAGYGFLLGMLTLYARTGTFVWSDPAMAGAFTTGVAVLFLIAGMAKSVMFPLHTWIPEAMNAPTPVSALLHSACYVKAGVYLIARMYSINDWHSDGNGALGDAMAAVGSVTILVGVIFALAQTDLKRLLAYHTVSQLGYIIAGLSLGTGYGIMAGLFYCLSHALFKGTLFMCAGAVQHACGTRDMKQLGGLAGQMPVTARIWLVASAAIAGVPLTNGFIAKWLLFGAALDRGLLFVVVAGWIGSVLTAFSFLKATVNTFYGVMPDALRRRPIHEAAPSMLLGMGAMAGLCVVFGVAPQLLILPVVSPAAAGLGFTLPVSVGWLGIATGTGTAAVTVGAGVVVAASLLAYGVYRAVQASPAATELDPVAVFSGGEPLAPGNRPAAADFAGMAEAAFAPVYYATPDPLYRIGWQHLTRICTTTQRLAAATVEARPAITIAVTALLVVVGVVLT